MQLRSFNAPSMQAAMALVRETLGVDAIIVSTHESLRGRGVQVTAAVEDPKFEPAAAIGADGDAAPDNIFAQVLSYHGVPGPLSLRLAAAATRIVDEDHVVALAAALDESFLFEDIVVSAEQPIMLVGASGVGKTTSVAKLAARQCLTGKSVALLTTDTVRAGAITQLKGYADLLEQPLFTAHDLDSYRRALARAKEGHAVIIDTPGTNPFSDTEVADLRRFIDADAVEPILVQPAGLDSEDAAESARIFRSLGCRKMLAVRLDAARRLGSVLAAADTGNLALTEVSVTPSVAQGLMPINPMSLARVLCRDPFESGLSKSLRVTGP